jgi:glycosyltransferase involved in cell wall biosynthesis
VIALQKPATTRRERIRLAPPPTVCHLLHSLSVGGAEVLAARIARRLDGPYRVVFACLDELGTLGRELRKQGLPIHVIGRGSGFDLGCARRLARLLRQEQVRLVHAHQYTPFFYAVASGWFRRRPPVLFTEHGRWFPDYPRRKRIVFNRLMLRRGDRVVGVGQAVCRALVENEGIPARRVGLIYNGIDLPAFDRRQVDRTSLRAEIGCARRDLVIMQVARLDHLKDHGTALRTLERVVRRRPDARLVLIGQGPERASIVAEACRRNLDPYVRFLGLRTDVARLLPAADMFLLTSISEGIPLTLIEAMAARLPVVSTDVGGVPEVVEHGVTGLLASSGDDAALAEAVLKLADCGDLAHSLGQAGAERAARLFSEEQMMSNYAELYREMLDG